MVVNMYKKSSRILQSNPHHTKTNSPKSYYEAVKGESLREPGGTHVLSRASGCFRRGSLFNSSQRKSPRRGLTYMIVIFKLEL